MINYFGSNVSQWSHKVPFLAMLVVILARERSVQDRWVRREGVQVWRHWEGDGCWEEETAEDFTRHGRVRRRGWPDCEHFSPIHVLRSIESIIFKIIFELNQYFFLNFWVDPRWIEEFQPSVSDREQDWANVWHEEKCENGGT